jgi:stearoyl-CoA desaturase (Delta-9 desaturase)
MPVAQQVVHGEKSDSLSPFPLAGVLEPAYQWLHFSLAALSVPLVVVHWMYFGHQTGVGPVLIVMSLVTGLGVTVGFHRLFTHRSFETTRPIQLILAVLGSMAGFGFFFSWVSAHRQHHQFSDGPSDPHSPNVHGDTFWSRLAAVFHSHGGWMFSDRMTVDRLRYIPDLMDDPTLRIIQRLQLLWIALGLALPALFCYVLSPTWEAATAGLLWGGLLRIVISSQVNFCVNSICHLWGPRPFVARDGSRNNYWVGMIAFGEGWHNNHHAFPTSARHGLLPGQFDLSYSLIRMLERLGLAWNVKIPTSDQLRAKMSET